MAAVVKYADNLLKTYATAIAIVLTFAVTCITARTAPSLGFLQGLAMVGLHPTLHLSLSRPLPVPLPLPLFLSSLAQNPPPTTHR